MTGPKGVIADAKAFEREKRGKKSSDFKRTMDLALPRSQSYGGKSPTPDRRGNPRSGSEDVEEDSGSDDDGSDDAEALRKWREKRTGEIKGSIGKTRERHWGTLENVTGLQFLEAVEKAGRGAIVLVYIFDDEVRSSSPSTTTANTQANRINSKPSATPSSRTSPTSPTSTQPSASSLFTTSTPVSTALVCLPFLPTETAINSQTSYRWLRKLTSMVETVKGTLRRRFEGMSREK